VGDRSTDCRPGLQLSPSMDVLYPTVQPSLQYCCLVLISLHGRSTFLYNHGQLRLHELSKNNSKNAFIKYWPPNLVDKLDRSFFISATSLLMKIY